MGSLDVESENLHSDLYSYTMSPLSRPIGVRVRDRVRVSLSYPGHPGLVAVLLEGRVGLMC